MLPHANIITHLYDCQLVYLICVSNLSSACAVTYCIASGAACQHMYVLLKHPVLLHTYQHYLIHSKATTTPCTIHSQSLLVVFKLFENLQALSNPSTEL